MHSVTLLLSYINNYLYILSLHSPAFLYCVHPIVTVAVVVAALYWRLQKDLVYMPKLLSKTQFS